MTAAWKEYWNNATTTVLCAAQRSGGQISPEQAVAQMTTLDGHGERVCKRSMITQRYSAGTMRRPDRENRDYESPVAG